MIANVLPNIMHFNMMCTKRTLFDPVVFDDAMKRQVASAAIEYRRGDGFVPIYDDLVERCVKAADGMVRSIDILAAMEAVIDAGLRAKGAIQMPWGRWVKP